MLQKEKWGVLFCKAGLSAMISASAFDLADKRAPSENRRSHTIDGLTGIHLDQSRVEWFSFGPLDPACKFTSVPRSVFNSSLNPGFW